MERLIGSVQNYAWGDRRVLAELQCRSIDGGPEAELWLGAHPVAPSRLALTDRTLEAAVAADPEALLGPDVSAEFGRFPYLLKVLAAAEPLSLQVHPSLERAAVGYAAENAAGLAVDDETRSYRDANHKPELICALTAFEAKCGFRPLPETIGIVDHLLTVHPSEGLSTLGSSLRAEAPQQEVLAGALRWLLGLATADAAKLVGEVCEAAERVLDHAELPSTVAPFRPDLEWLAELDRVHPGDIGVVVSLLLNHVVLEPGQAMFLGAGNLHSYLRGAGVELMANSDNVIRGGLTVKHVDVEELLQVVDTRPSRAPVQTASADWHRYEAPVPDFSLTRISSAALAAPAELVPLGPEIVLVTEGGVTLVSEGADSVALGKGESAFVSWSDGPYRLAAEAGTTAWRATVGNG